MRNRLTFVSTVAMVCACGGSGAGTSNPPPPPPPGAFTAIYDVQGNGAASPLVGQTVTVEGVVTGDFQENDADATRNLGGFYIQNVPDADVETSDGIFVFDGDTPAVDVNPGDLARVEGSVVEYFGETQIQATSVAVVGAGAIQAAPINLPAEGTVLNSDGELIADLERYEGMLIQLPQALTVTALFNLERYGEVGLVQGGRPYQFTNRNTPDVAGYNAHREVLAARTLLLDDGRRESNPTPIMFLTAGSAPNYSLRSGDQVTGLTGNLRFSRGSGGSGSATYRLVPTIDPQFTAQNPRPAVPSVGGALTVVSINALNFFSTTDSGQATCGPTASSSCRGADSAGELARQSQKLATTLNLLDADIVGLVEIENNGGVALQTVVDALNAASSSTYDFVDTGVIGTDTIATAFVYKPSTVAMNGTPAILDTGVDPRFDDTRNRPALAQSFMQITNNAVFSVVVNHLKSKGSPCDGDGDPNLGDGQGNCNATRTSAAAALADWIALDPTGSGDADYLVIGDLNAYVFEDPLSTLKNAGFVNLVEAANGGAAYSFAFDGQSGALDHALATPSLVPQVAATAEWHINADEPPVRDYNLENGRDPALFDAATPYRTSDHDPVVVGLDLDP